MNEYLGFKEVVLSGNEINAVFDTGHIFDLANHPETESLLQNEYLIAKDADGNTLGIFKFNGKILEKVLYKVIKSDFAGMVKPRNLQQQLAIDLLYDENTTIKIITGCFGAGKDHLMSSAAMDLIEKNRFEKIVYVRNNIEVKDSRPIGFLPGSYNEKLLPFVMPLADKFGGLDGLDLMIEQGKIEIIHLGFIRGRDIKNSIIYCPEAENMTKEHIQLLIGRVGEGSMLWINGDFKQCDASIFKQNNGLVIAIDKLKGHPRFGYVKLLKSERSETAAMADLLD